MICYFYIICFLCLPMQAYSCSDPKYKSEISNTSTPRPTILLPLPDCTIIHPTHIVTKETELSPAQHFTDIPRLIGIFYQETFIPESVTTDFIEKVYYEITPSLRTKKPLVHEIIKDYKKETLVYGLAKPSSFADTYSTKTIGTLIRTISGFKYSNETIESYQPPKICFTIKRPGVIHFGTRTYIFHN